MVSNNLATLCSNWDRLDWCLMKSIHFQGESNAEPTDTYSCSISALVSDWRQKWNSATAGNTDPLFSFGQVQVKL